MATRSQLEHAIRTATEIIAHDSILIIGSQSILGTWREDELPPDVTESVEFDACPLADDEAESLATLLDGVAGEWSPFHELHEFYIQGVGARTAQLPDGWQDRLVRVSNDNTHGRVGLCLDPHDLCSAKLLAGREKDFRFVSALVAARLIDPHRLRQCLLATTSTSEAQRSRALKYLDSLHRPPSLA